MSMPDTEGLETPGEEVSNDRDMTIGELYEIHEELNELEKNVQAGESIEEIKKELEKPKKERRLGSFFRRRDSQSKAEKEVSPKENEVTDGCGRRKRYRRKCKSKRYGSCRQSRSCSSR